MRKPVTVVSIGACALIVLSGCGTDAAEPVVAPSATSTATSESTVEPAATAGPNETAAATKYADGSYAATGQYRTPQGFETVEITVTIENDAITAVKFVGDPQRRESQTYQGQFVSGLDEAVVGKAIDDVKLDRVAGSSLTSGGFNAALEAIKQEAATS